MYVILAVGITSTLVSLLSRKKAPKLSFAFQIVTVIALVAAGLYYSMTSPYHAFIEALSAQFG